MSNNYIQTNGIKLHYLENENQARGYKDTILLMHGLTANAYCFNAYMRDLTEYRVISVDLRGRGLSDKPDSNYSMEDHARDVLGLMDQLHLDKVVLGGHSFGARLSMYMAYFHPERVKKVVLIDAADKLHPKVREMVMPSLMRLGRVWDSFDDYLDEIRQASYLEGVWSEDFLSYFRGDVKTLDDGKVTTQSSLDHMQRAIEGVLSPGEQWTEIIENIQCPTLLINATGNYALDAPILPGELALDTVAKIPDCTYRHVSGNHFTMLFGKGALETVNAIRTFLK